MQSADSLKQRLQAPARTAQYRKRRLESEGRHYPITPHLVVAFCAPSPIPISAEHPSLLPSATQKPSQASHPLRDATNTRRRPSLSHQARKRSVADTQAEVVALRAELARREGGTAPANGAGALPSLDFAPLAPLRLNP